MAPFEVITPELPSLDSDTPQLNTTTEKGSNEK
jgi:hypothetical protein